VEDLRAAFNSGITLPLSYRKHQLQQLLKFVVENQLELQNALYEDLRKGEQEAIVTEIAYVRNEIADVLDHLDDWAAPEYPSVDPAFMVT
jgi:aldehyde dehydrogenase (NAD+)